jgi:hypothetical protein
MNETNRTAIILLAALWIVLMAVAIFLAWTEAAGSVGELRDLVGYLEDHQDEDASRLILTLGALVLIVLALLVIVVELAPEEETREIRVEQAGATTIVPAEPLRLRLEEALTAMAHVSAARARVFSHDKGIGMKLDLTVTPDANIAVVTQEASRVVVETLQADLGLPVSASPSVRIIFGPRPVGAPVASSVAQPPTPEAPAAPEAARPAEPPPAPEPPAVGPVAEAPEPPQQTPTGEGEWPPAPPPSSYGGEEPPAPESTSADEPQQQ